MIHPVVGVSGSAPAYVFMFIEAMADAAVLGGMRAQAKLPPSGHGLSQNGTGNRQTSGRAERYGLLGGTTIEAVKVLEEKRLPLGGH